MEWLIGAMSVKEGAAAVAGAHTAETGGRARSSRPIRHGVNLTRPAHRSTGEWPSDFGARRGAAATTLHLAPHSQPVDIEVPLGSVGTQEANGREGSPQPVRGRWPRLDIRKLNTRHGVTPTRADDDRCRFSVSRRAHPERARPVNSDGERQMPSLPLSSMVDVER
jgi:hypothetical protein